jgi:hypothetical protein
LFKIFTKALTHRIGPALDKIIHSYQNAFIKGRFITDGVMLLQEVLREVKYRKQQGVVLKLDFEKAYDKVNWDFPFDCCIQQVFSDKFLVWIKQSVMKWNLSVKVNVECGPCFGSFKGVRQGDPLAPSLFNINVNSLSKMIRKAQQNGMIGGLAEHIIPGGISILRYADDIVILIKNSLE